MGATRPTTTLCEVRTTGGARRPLESRRLLIARVGIDRRIALVGDDKRDLSEVFVSRVSTNGAIDDGWQAFIAAKREAERDSIITAEGLRPEAAREFIETAFRDGALRTTGTAITKVLPPASRFSEDGGHGAKKQRVIEKLVAYFERFFGLGSGSAD
jgi:type I restriction enzyme, R subunit